MSPLRWRNESVAENVGAPLVTPGVGTAQWNPSANGITPQMGNRGIRPPRQTPPGHPGDMNVAPTWAKRIRRGKRGGATCDARCRHGTTKRPRMEFRPQMGTPAFVRPGKPCPSSGRHECRPYGGGLRKTCGGAICDARCRRGTTESVRPGKSRPSSGRHECRPYVGETNPSRKTWGRHL